MHSEQELLERITELEQRLATGIRVFRGERKWWRAKRAELEADAARYRWLREFRGWPFAESPGWTALDAAIDAARQETGE